jgi:putative OPT family oligopeptide transporter
MSDSNTSRPRPTTNSNPIDDAPLPVAGFQGTPDEIERQWFEQVYTGRGDRMRQLTWRAVLMGIVLGGVLSTTNIYIGLKAGWSFGVVITASILSFSIWQLLLKLRIARTPMTILENNCMQSTASAAGYSTGTTLVSAFSAYVMLNNTSLPLWEMIAWVFFTAVLGITMAIPMKRQLVNVEQLRFPTGTAAAETLRALYSHGEKAARAAKALTLAGLLAAASQFWADGLRLVSVKLAPFSLSEIFARGNELVFGKVWMARTVMFNWDPIFIAAGALSGLRVTASMFLGGTLCWVVYVPLLQQQGIITGTGYRDTVSWTLWGGVACMVTSGLLQFFMEWKSIVRAFSGLAGIFGKQKTAAQNEMEAIESPAWWFFAGQLIALTALAWLAHRSFQMPLWQSIVAVVLSFFLALVACRVTGETDTTPIGPMGKVTQLIFGVLSPGNMNVNLMSANITSSAAIGSADLLTDLKSGYLLGANPRKQFLAQFAGIFIGTLATVLCWRALVPDASAIGNDQFPAPAAQTWKAVALAMSKGIASLEPMKVWSLAIGGLVGIILPLLTLLRPKWKAWIPSPAALGLAWTFHWYYSLLFFLGGLAAWVFEQKRPKLAEEFTFPAASGIIAGGSLMGLALIFWENGAEMVTKLFHEITGK